MRVAETIHASAVSVAGKGVLIRGRSGSGKSSLLLSLLVSRSDAILVADDQVAIASGDGRLVASAPPAIAGQIEVRGLGIVRRPFVSPIVVAMVVDLLPRAQCPRLPAPAERSARLAGINLPRIFIAIGAPDAAVRVLAGLAAFDPDFDGKSLI